MSLDVMREKEKPAGCQRQVCESESACVSPPPSLKAN